MVTGAVDQIAKQWPQLTFVLTPFKALINDLFAIGTSSDTNAATMEKLKEIDKHLDSMEANLKQHSEDLAAFTSIGKDFQDVKKYTRSLSDKITGIRYAFEIGEITEEEYNKEIAALYNSAEYAALTSALNGATLDYDGDTSYAIDEKSIFGAAYNLQCNKVMFSGEAIDCTTPYLLRQLATYFRGYAVVNVVLDSYEQVNGTSRTVTIRKTMYEDTERVVKLYKDYFNTHRYTFLNKSSNPVNHVRLNQKIILSCGFTKEYVGSKAVGDENKLKSYTPLLPTGPQFMTYESSYSTGSSRPSYNYMQAIQINKVGAEDTKILLADKYQVQCNPMMLFFTR